AELGPAVASLGGTAGALLSNSTALAEDGRIQVGASGLCLWDPEDPERPAVVLTCAAAFAPFLAKRFCAFAGEAPSGHRPQQSVVDPELVATTELFAIFPPEFGGSSCSASLAPTTASSQSVVMDDSRIVKAILVACLPMPASEEAFAALQASIGKPSDAASQALSGMSKQVAL
ncbi:unnamed protein product, partial [Polarella glacialis]